MTTFLKPTRPLLFCITLLSTLPLTFSQPPPAHAQPTPSSTPQQQLQRAKQLAQLQRFDQAIPLAEEAFLSLNDPEILRILALWYSKIDQFEKSLGLYDSYLEHPDIGTMSKERVQPERDRIYAKVHGTQPTSPNDTPKDDPNNSGWETQGADLAAPGTVFLSLRGHYTHNPGPSFTTQRGGSGPDADTNITGSWTHGGVGLNLGAGYFFTPHLGVAGHLGLDWMSWEHLAPSSSFETTLFSGLRPETIAELLILIDWGLFASIEVGADWIILTEGLDPTKAPCKNPNQATSTCERIDVVQEGLHGWRPILGAGLGYRTPLSSAWHIGVRSSLRWLPTTSPSQDITRNAPAYTDSGWIFQAGLELTWDLNPPAKP